MTLGERLREARLNRGMTAGELSQHAGVSAASISHYENDNRWPTLYTAACIAGALNISLDWLAGRKENMEVFDDD